MKYQVFQLGFWVPSLGATGFFLWTALSVRANTYSVLLGLSLALHVIVVLALLATPRNLSRLPWLTSIALIVPLLTLTMFAFMMIAVAFGAFLLSQWN